MKRLSYNVGFILLILVFVVAERMQAQSDKIEKQIQFLTDSIKQIYGASELLVNGPYYYQDHLMANGSPFLFNQEFVKGEIFINDREFSRLKLNYDVSRQMLVLLVTTNESKLIVSLSNKIVDSLYIDNQLYVNSKYIMDCRFPYLNQINKGNYRMYIGYEKEFINRYDNEDPYGRYSNSHSTMYVFIGGKYYEVTSNSSFLNLFPLHKKEIKTYLKQNKIRIHKASSIKLTELLIFCNNIVD